MFDGGEEEEEDVDVKSSSRRVVKLAFWRKSWDVEVDYCIRQVLLYQAIQPCLIWKLYRFNLSSCLSNPLPRPLHGFEHLQLHNLTP